MKRILFIWQHIGNDGGGEFALINLVNQLKAHYRIDILCYEQIHQQSVANGINIFFAGTPRQSVIGKTINKIRLWLKLLRISHNYELLILNDIPFINLIVWVTSKFTKAKYLIWTHSCRNEMKPKHNRLINALYKKSLVAANRIICVSNYAAQSMHDYLPGSQIRTNVIYNIISREIPPNDPINLPQGIIKICAAGRLTHEKNFGLLIDALFHTINQIDKPVHLYICGKGIERKKLQQQIDNYKLNGNITMVGYTPNIMSYINQCNIFVSSSNSDSFSLVVYEALLCNKPIITTKTGAAEIIEYGKYGIVVEKQNIAQMSEALVKLIINDKLRKDYEEKAHEALKKFNKEAIIHQWLGIIESVIMHS